MLLLMLMIRVMITMIMMIVMMIIMVIMMMVKIIVIFTSTVLVFLTRTRGSQFVAMPKRLQRMPQFFLTHIE